MPAPFTIVCGLFTTQCTLFPNRPFVRRTMLVADRESDRGSAGEESLNAAWPASDEEHRAVFARLFAEHDRWLYAYLMTLLGSPADAQEVFQEVCVVLWKDYQRFELGTSFVKWASVIALNQVRRFRRTQRRQPAMLSDGVVEILATEAVERSDLLDARRTALHHCIDRLRQQDRELVKQCYSGAYASLRDAAERLGRPANTVYKAMGRIRRALHDCINRTLAGEGVR
ncbi:MAG: sigma-70 family RNA polymerase sigma factor [Planctomycetota bacterium]